MIASTANNENPHFLLVGNGPYLNRGCEAIVRGTMTILRREFGEDFRATVASFGPIDVIAAQAENETDPLVEHIALHGTPMKRWSSAWWHRQGLRLLGRTPDPYPALNKHCEKAACALEIGGDNYSLDYGLPIRFLALDHQLQKHAVPVVLWGASVGPFDANPRFAKRMFAHLHEIRHIFVRESLTQDYLKLHGIEANQSKMADPAFLMDPIEPDKNKLACTIPEGAIGLNFSPLMAKFICDGNMDEWTDKCVNIVRDIRARIDRTILLIPHVSVPKDNSGVSHNDFTRDDPLFSERIAARFPGREKNDIICISDKLSAAETKWVISKCAAFAGARTHSTIASISSCVPTISLAYSIKAKGINQDVFGSQKYCVYPNQMSSESISERIVSLLENADYVQERICQVLPQIRESAFQAGSTLRRIL